ncbi:MAG TPA: GNAT family N-acetyltransferase [Chryseosolibacter sp.]
MMTIRPATLEDIPVIAEFQIRLAAETESVHLDRALVSTGIHALFNDPSKGTYYVAESGAEVAGCFLITYEWSDWRNAMIWWLQSVYVAEPERKKGVFRKMHEYIIETISNDPAIAGLRLYVEKSNVRAQAVYRSLGMDGDHYTVFEWMRK